MGQISQRKQYVNVTAVHYINGLCCPQVIETEAGAYLLEDIKRNVLREMAGFCANQNLSRTAGDIGFPEYDIIKDMRDQGHAIAMSVMADIRMLQNRYYYRSIDDFIQDITEVEDSYKLIMKRDH